MKHYSSVISNLCSLGHVHGAPLFLGAEFGTTYVELLLLESELKITLRTRLSITASFYQ